MEVLTTFCKEHGDARAPIEAWVAEVQHAQWKGPNDVKAVYPSASILANSIFIFNIKGNRYRLETQIAFGTGVVLLKRAGTHAEYDRW
ncbi:MAG TPA: type II toxin-antitoxin system HigB family toxin [Myxococcales bacterium]